MYCEQSNTFLSENGRYDGDSFLCWITPVDRRSFADYFTCGTYPKLLYSDEGMRGDGISLAAVTGKVIEELLNEKETIIPIEPLRLSRFTERVLNG